LAGEDRDDGRAAPRQPGTRPQGVRAVVAGADEQRHPRAIDERQPLGHGDGEAG
jgi:hypothetical protein